MTRGEIYRTRDVLAERGFKAGYFVVVSRDFIAENEDVLTVVCAPVYSREIGLDTEVQVGPNDGFPKDSVIRCDFVQLLFKKQLRNYFGKLSEEKMRRVNRALRLALDCGPTLVD